MKEFLVTERNGSPFEQLFVVEAEHIQEAQAKSVYHLYQTDNIFKEHMFTRCVNMSFAEQFWLQTAEEDRVFNLKGEIIIDENEFIQRVKTYFGSHTNAAEEYLAFWFLDGTDSEVEVAFEKFMSNNEKFLIGVWLLFADFFEEYSILDISEIRRI